MIIMTDFEYVVLVGKSVKESVHGVEHADHISGSDITADVSESFDVCEHNADFLVQLKWANNMYLSFKLTWFSFSNCLSVIC